MQRRETRSCCCLTLPHQSAGVVAIDGEGSDVASDDASDKNQKRVFFFLFLAGVVSVRGDSIDWTA